MDYVKLRRVIEEIAKGVVSSRTFAKKVHATLVSVSPLEFKLSDNISIKGPNCITPRFRVFRSDEIGRTFVFQEDDQGQQYIYQYEATKEPGSNGEPYKFKGDIKCTLYGTCPDGEVVVTHGTIEELKHLEGVE